MEDNLVGLASPSRFFEGCIFLPAPCWVTGTRLSGYSHTMGGLLDNSTLNRCIETGDGGVGDSKRERKYRNYTIPIKRRGWKKTDGVNVQSYPQTRTLILEDIEKSQVKCQRFLLYLTWQQESTNSGLKHGSQTHYTPINPPDHPYYNMGE